MSKPSITQNQAAGGDRLAALRAEIDDADAELVRVLARRFVLVEQIGDIKAMRGEPVIVPARIEAVLSRVETHARAAGLDPATARRLWRAIIDEACALEEAHIALARPPSAPTATAKREASPLAVRATEVAPDPVRSVSPEPFYSLLKHRIRRRLGNVFGLKNFGVNLTTLPPGRQSSMLHRHSKQDEFILVLEGDPTLVTDEGEVALRPGMCAGFAAGGRAHHLMNRTEQDVVYLEVGDRTAGDEGAYPDDDLRAIQSADGRWVFTHKDGRPY